jgi:hypothetical protein
MRPWFRFLAYGIGGLFFLLAVVALVLARDVDRVVIPAAIGMIFTGLAWRYRHFSL